MITKQGGMFDLLSNSPKQIFKKKYGEHSGEFACGYWEIKGKRPCQGVGVGVTHLNFKTSPFGVYKCLSLIVGFAVTVTIWPREVVSCRDFILRTVPTFWAMSLV